jgi:hypothetical protein
MRAGVGPTCPAPKWYVFLFLLPAIDTDYVKQEIVHFEHENHPTVRFRVRRASTQAEHENHPHWVRFRVRCV